MRFVFGECELDTERYELRRAGPAVALEPKAFRVLAYLLRHHGRAVAKRDLLPEFWPGPRKTAFPPEDPETYLANLRFQRLGTLEELGL